jgi:hypothetical protein
MIKSRQLQGTVAVLLILMSSMSFAVEHPKMKVNIGGPYVAASAGYAIVNYVPNSVAKGQSADTQKQSGGIGQIGGGYMHVLRSNWAVGAEASYTNYPDFKQTNSNGEGGTVSVTAQSTSLNVLGVVSYFMNNFSFSAKAGPAYLVSKVQGSSSSDPEFGKFANGTLGNVGWMTEAGVAYYFEPGLAFTLAFQYSFQSVSILGQNQKLNPYGVLAGFSYNFGALD